MAKLLGQEIVTHEEFTAFKEQELSVVTSALESSLTEIALLKTQKKSFDLSTALATLALVISLVTLVLTRFH